MTWRPCRDAARAFAVAVTRCGAIFASLGSRIKRGKDRPTRSGIYRARRKRPPFEVGWRWRFRGLLSPPCRRHVPAGPRHPRASPGDPELPVFPPGASSAPRAVGGNGREYGTGFWGGDKWDRFCCLIPPPHGVVPTNVGTHPEMGQPLRSERWRASGMGPGFRRGDSGRIGELFLTWCCGRLGKKAGPRLKAGEDSWLVWRWKLQDRVF